MTPVFQKGIKLFRFLVEVIIKITSCDSLQNRLVSHSISFFTCVLLIFSPYSLLFLINSNVYWDMLLINIKQQSHCLDHHKKCLTSSELTMWGKQISFQNVSKLRTFFFMIYDFLYKKPVFWQVHSALLVTYMSIFNRKIKKSIQIIHLVKGSGALQHNVKTW